MTELSKAALLDETPEAPRGHVEAAHARASRRSLYRSASYLASNGMATTALSYLFWIVAARLYAKEAVGVAGGVMASLGLIATVADLGLGVATIHYLNAAVTARARLLGSVVILTNVTALVIGAVVLALAPYVAPQLAFLRADSMYAIIFLVGTVVWMQTSIAGSIYAACRANQYSLIQDTGAAALKLLFVFPLAWFVNGSFGLVLSTALPMAVMAVLSSGVWIPRLAGVSRLRLRVSLDAVRPLLWYSSANYLGRVALDAQLLLVPILTLNALGAGVAGGFYIAWVAALMPRMVPTAVSNALFSECSNDVAKLTREVGHALRLVIGLSVAAVAGLWLCADLIFLVFGRKYSGEAPAIFRILLFANIPWSVTYLLINIYRVRAHQRLLLFTAFSVLASTIGAVLVALPSQDPKRIALAYGIGHVLGCALSAGAFLWDHGRGVLRSPR